MALRRVLRETDVVPGVAAVGGLLGATLGLDLPVVAGLGVAAGLYLGVRLLMPAPDPEVAPGVTRGQLDAAVAGFGERLDRITALAGQVAKPAVRRRLETLIATGGRVVTHVREDPADLPVARPLLELYLDSAAQILDNYVRLSSRQVASAAEPLAKAEDEAIPLLEGKVTELYEQLQREEVVELTVDSELLEFRTRGIT